jgi:hypothetical protein
MKNLKHQILIAICFTAVCIQSKSDNHPVIPTEFHGTKPHQLHNYSDKQTINKPLAILAKYHPQSGLNTTLTQWGFLGHKTINQHAVFALPQPLFGFYKKHIQFITDHAVDPDQRRYTDTAEACRHYIDLDHYEKALPIDTLPKYWKQAVETFTADTLFAYGIVPYHVQIMLYRLTEAFEEKNLAAILRLSADIGHYVADAHVPLHTTENYDGQLTHQHGIHALWETRIPEISLSSYLFLTETGHFLEQPADSIWNSVSQSHALLPTVLQTEKTLSQKWPQTMKYELSTDLHGKTKKQIHPQFVKSYETQLNHMVEIRMKQAIVAVASYWYTAWILSGQPNLDEISQQPQTRENTNTEKTDTVISTSTLPSRCDGLTHD